MSIQQTLLLPILKTPLISRIRRNHGLEHATLHVLSQRYRGKRIGGRSGPDGFWLMGEVPTEGARDAVHEALSRLRNGEPGLAVHPNCGTNFAVAGILAALASYVGMWRVGPRKRDKLERLPLVATLATLAIIVARPFGRSVQREITTSGNPGNLEIVEIVPIQKWGMKAHHIITRG